MGDESTETQYEFQPFEDILLARRDEISQLVGISTLSLRQMEGLGRLTTALRKPAAHVEKAHEFEAMAKQQVETDFPLLHGSATVLMWGALEAAIRDFVVRVLNRHPSARTLDEFKRVKVRIAEYEMLQGEERMRYLVGILERETAAPLRPGIARFDCLLSPLGISPVISSNTRRDLTEMAAIRNVIVHRASVADSRFVELCPWFEIKVGERLSVSSAAFNRYGKAVGEYAACIIESAEPVLKALADAKPAAS